MYTYFFLCKPIVLFCFLCSQKRCRCLWSVESILHYPRINSNAGALPLRLTNDEFTAERARAFHAVVNFFPRRSRDQETLGYLSSRSYSLLRTRCASLQSSKSTGIASVGSLFYVPTSCALTPRSSDPSFLCARSSVQTMSCEDSDWLLSQTFPEVIGWVINTQLVTVVNFFPRRSRDQETLGYLSSRSYSLLRTRCASLQSSKSKS